MPVFPSADYKAEFRFEDEEDDPNATVLYIRPARVRDLDRVNNNKDMLKLIVGWENVFDEDGKEVPFSEKARMSLPSGWLPEIILFINKISGVDDAEKND